MPCSRGSPHGFGQLLSPVSCCKMCTCSISCGSASLQQGSLPRRRQPCCKEDKPPAQGLLLCPFPSCTGQKVTSGEQKLKAFVEDGKTPASEDPSHLTLGPGTPPPRGPLSP